ncbi:MAG TPA: hypothetical protein VFX28_06085, partial [Methylomirabilota bacterium]|nr:hypothetical protein [Methylomirabilota bacterium]
GAEHLSALRALPVHPRLGAQVGRALELLALGELPPAVLRFVAASLEDEADWDRELREVRLLPRATLEPTWFIYGDRYGWYPYGWYPYRVPVHLAP